MLYLRYLIFKLINLPHLHQKKVIISSILSSLILYQQSVDFFILSESDRSARFWMELIGWQQLSFLIFPSLDLPRNQFFPPSIPQDKEKNKNCKLHIGNLPLNITEETLHRVFSKYGQIKEVKIIRKNSQGQPLKDYCYGFVLMCDGDGAQNAVTELKQNSPLGTTWTVAFSKDKNDDTAGAGHSKSDKKKDEKIKRKEKSKERGKKEKSKPKKKKKSESSSSSDSSRPRSAKKQKKQKKRKPSSSSESSSSKLPTRSALIKIENKANDNALMESIFSGDLQQQFMNQQPQQLYQIKYPVNVRELFISGIPQSKTSTDIQRIFSQYGIVERIDIVPKQLVNYAYVKFKRLDSVLAAIYNSQIIAELLESAGQVKIYNSDPFRRVQIVGNAEDSEKDEEMLPIMFIGFPPNPNCTVDEKFLKKMAEKYGGDVKGIQHFQPDSPQLRSYILIEFSLLKDCKKARRKFCRYKIQILGDKKCDVAILSNYSNNIQGKRQSNMYQQQPFGLDYMQVNQQMPMFPQMIQRPIPSQMPLIPQYQNQAIPPPQHQSHIPPNIQNMYDYNQLPMIYPPPAQQPQQQQMMFMRNPQQPQSQTPPQNPQQQYRPPPPQQSQQPQQQQQQPQYYQQINQQPPQNPNYMNNYTMDLIIPPPQQKQEDTNITFWSGFMNRGKQHRVGIDARIFQAPPDLKKINLPYNLEMSYKCTYQDAYIRAVQDQSAILIFSPASETDYPKFTEYVQYLRSKQRAGVIQSDTFTIYVIPPGVPEGQQICNISQQEMIAIYCHKEQKI